MKPQGIASESGGGSKTCWSIATSISAISHPSPAARMTPPPRTANASVRTKAPMSRSEAPRAAIVANSWRRSSTTRLTKSHIAAAASRIANASSSWVIPVRSTVVIELTVCTVCWSMFLTVTP